MNTKEKQNSPTGPEAYDHIRLIKGLVSALEICLECGKLNWAAEHDAEIAVARAKSALAAQGLLKEEAL